MKQVDRTLVRHAMQPVFPSISSEVRQEVLLIVGHVKHWFNCGSCKSSQRVSVFLFGDEFPDDEVLCARCGQVTKFPAGSILTAFARITASASKRGASDEVGAED